MKQKILSVILIFCISFTVAGYYPVFKMLQYRVRQEIKHRIKAGLSESQLQIITFRKQDTIDWVRPGKEFRLNGQFFDVVRKESKAGNLIFHCINDQQEKALFATLDQMVKNNLNDGQTSESQTALLLCKIFTETYYWQEITIFYITCCREVCFTDYLFSELQVYRTPECPPPDAA
jgi:hypothetical protein